MKLDVKTQWFGRPRRDAPTVVEQIMHYEFVNSETFTNLKYIAPDMNKYLLTYVILRDTIYSEVRE